MAATDIPDILDKLLIRRESLAREAAALDNLIAVYQGLLRQNDTESLFNDEQLPLYRKPTSRAAQAAEIAQAIESARKLIIQERRPMKRGELVNRLEKLGFSLPGKDKNKVFGTNIWRSGKFRMVDDRGYWPKDVALPK